MNLYFFHKVQFAGTHSRVWTSWKFSFYAVCDHLSLPFVGFKILENKIESVDKDAFSNLKALRMLDLWDNKIEKVGTID